jgi:hypothetical protein
MTKWSHTSMAKFAYSFISFLFVAMLIASCAGVKNSAGPGKPGMVKIFTKGKDTLLCHAGPVKYNASASHEYFEMDHTYLKVKGHSNPVVCNFSLITRDDQFRPTAVSVQLDGQVYNYDHLEKFFAEGYGKNDYKYRYSFSVPDSVFYNWMQCEEPLITINGKSFKGGKSFRKGANTIYRMILFDLY